jgi:hypothetical protein
VLSFALLLHSHGHPRCRAIARRGSNVPALNAALAPFDISFGSTVYSGDIDVSMALTMDADTLTKFASGVGVTTFPATGVLFWASLTNQSARVLAHDSAPQTEDMKPVTRTAHVQPLMRVPVGGMYVSVLLFCA